MKLYSAPGFTSLADHIAMLEAGIQFDVVKVDIETSRSKGVAAISISIRRAMCPLSCLTTVRC